MTHQESTSLRFASVFLVLGTVLYIVPSALHGNPPIESAQETLAYVHQRSFWRPVHLINILAVLIWAGVFTIIGPIVAGTARHLGRIVGSVFGASAAVFAVYFSIHAVGLMTVADQYFASGADQAAVLERTETILVLLGSAAFTAQAMVGGSIALAGLLLTRSAIVPRWIGLLGLVAGGGWLVGAALVNFDVIVPFTTLTWLWTAILAVVLFRASRSDRTNHQGREHTRDKNGV